jgi:hypothetical protein
LFLEPGRNGVSALLACASFRVWPSVAFTALGLSCVRAVCWESLPGGRVMQSSFSVWWVLGRLGAHPQGIEATVVVVQVKRSYTPPRGRHSRPTMHASVLSASHRAKMSCITRQQPACTYAPCPAWHPSDCQRVAKQEMQRTNTASLIKLQHHTQHTTPRLSLPVVHRHARSR